MRWAMVTIVLFPLCTNAQWERLSVDRPDQTNGTSTVPAGYAQLESGAVLSPRSHDITVLNAPQMLLRIGLGEHLEFRAEGEFVRTLGEDKTVSETWHTPSLGLKMGFGKGGGTGIRTAALLDLGFPHWGNEEEGHTYASVTFAADRDLNKLWSMGGNLGLRWNSSGAAPITIYTLTNGFNLSRRLGAFAEVYGIIPGYGTSDSRWDCGGSWAFGPNMVADVSFGHGFEGQAWFFGAGFSFRVHVW